MGEAISWIIVLFILISIGSVVIGFIMFLAKLFSPKNGNNQQNIQQKTETAQETKMIVGVEKRKRDAIKCTPFIKDAVGVEVIEQKQENGSIYIYFYVYNLSENILPFELINAFYVTSEGEQIRGNITEATIMEFNNSKEKLGTNVILPSLKVRKSAFFYKKNIIPNYSDVLLIRVKCFGEVYLLSTFVFK